MNINLIKNLFKYPNQKFGQIKQTYGSPVIKQKQIEKLADLKPHFNALTSHSLSNNGITNSANIDQL